MNERNRQRGARLDGRVAVVTGGGRGIGRATARVLTRAGAAVVVAARTVREIEETAEVIRRGGGQALAVPTDVSDWSAMEQLARETKRAFGPADIVVANAGVLGPVGDMWTVAPEDWARNLDVNLTGAFYAARAFLPAMVERGKGVLIFVSSGAAAHPIPGWSAYCAAKAGLDHFIRNLAAEIDQQHLPIRVHALYPGVVDTQMQAQIRRMDRERFSQVDKYRAYHQQGVLRPPEKPATLIWWLATPMAAEFHGQALSIDDVDVRRRLADDLGVPMFGARGG
jgi:NAD(P)-dependent dehydrogenase (short-subunit alcohol dehydrogenase family)